MDAYEFISKIKRKEIKEKSHLCDCFEVKLEHVLCARANSNVNIHGSYMPHLVEIPTGMEFNVVEHENYDIDGAINVNGDE